jgi:hypothetical protein
MKFFNDEKIEIVRKLNLYLILYYLFCEGTRALILCTTEENYNIVDVFQTTLKTYFEKLNKN